MGYYDHDCEEWQEAEKDQYLDDKIWVSSEGVEIPVKELESGYLDNIIKWIRDNGFHREAEWIQVLEEEAERRTKNMFDNMED